jgi:hypothetical protein
LLNIVDNRCSENGFSAARDTVEPQEVIMSISPRLILTVLEKPCSGVGMAKVECCTKKRRGFGWKEPIDDAVA